MMNRATIAGRLGADPEERQSKGGPICHFSIATSEKYTGRDRELHEDVQWHRIVVFGKYSEPCMQFLKKGSQVLVEGKIKTRSYEDESGQKRYVTEIIASRVIFLGHKEGNPDGGIPY